MKTYQDLSIQPRILMGPGPSMVSPRVLNALSYPLVGHLDPQFLTVMDEVQELLRYVFQTKNLLTIPISGTGSAGMEAAVSNFIEPGDAVLVCVCGYFGERIAEMASRYGAEVDRLTKPWGSVFEVEEIEVALKKRHYALVAIVHGETSTGICQPLDGLAKVVHHEGALLLVDTVASLGGVNIPVDELGLDIVYSGSQKCLSCPPGLAPLTVGPDAYRRLKQRKSKMPNWYLDLTMLENYWGENRVYHHTAPINMVYAMREALRLVYEEGLENQVTRHRSNAQLLWNGLSEINLEMIVPEAYRLPTLTTVYTPIGVDDADLQKKLLTEYNIEIARGLGMFKGKAWRIGLMGYSSRKENVTLLLAALKQLIDAQEASS